MLRRMGVLAVLGVLAVAPMVRSAPPILDLSDSDEVEEAMASGEESGWGIRPLCPVSPKDRHVSVLGGHI